MMFPNANVPDANVSWTCHVCGELRQDHLISVYSRVGMIGTVPYTENVRYCNDRPACVAGATKVRFIKPEEASP